MSEWSKEEAGQLLAGSGSCHRRSRSWTQRFSDVLHSSSMRSLLEGRIPRFSEHVQDQRGWRDASPCLHHAQSVTSSTPRTAAFRSRESEMCLSLPPPSLYTLLCSPPAPSPLSCLISCCPNLALSSGRRIFFAIGPSPASRTRRRGACLNRRSCSTRSTREGLRRTCPRCACSLAAS